MFSSTDHEPIEDVNWSDDLKFFIDNNDALLERYIFPAVKKHANHIENPNAWKLYVPGIKKCLGIYCDKFDIDPKGKFTYNIVEELAKHIAQLQAQHIKQGDYNASE